MSARSAAAALQWQIHRRHGSDCPGPQTGAGLRQRRVELCACGGSGRTAALSKLREVRADWESACLMFQIRPSYCTSHRASLPCGQHIDAGFKRAAQSVPLRQRRHRGGDQQPGGAGLHDAVAAGNGSVPLPCGKPAAARASQQASTFRLAPAACICCA